MKEPVITDIPASMEKFFGCSGKMIKPSLDNVKEIVQNVKKGELITLEQIREKLAREFSVESTCPASTVKALQILSKEEKPVCYWRTVKKNGELISKFPNGVEGHAFLLQKEGFEINFDKKNPTVANFNSKL